MVTLSARYGNRCFDANNTRDYIKIKGVQHEPHFIPLTSIFTVHRNGVNEPRERARLEKGETVETRRKKTTEK